MASRTTSIKITGNVTEALAALDKLGIRTEEVAKETESRMGGAAEKTGGLFGKLGNTLGNWGLPFSESLSKIGEHIGEAETKGKKFGATMQEVGKVALLAGAAGFGAVAAESVKLGVNYQQATAKIAASSGTSVAAAKAVGDEFLKTGFKSTFSAQEIATAYGGVAGQLKATEGHALSAGDAMTVMQGAMDLSEASGASLNDTAAALAGTMQAYGLKTKDAAKAGDQLYNISVLTNQPILGLAQVLDRLKGRLGALAPSLSDVGSLMAFPSVAAQGSRGAMVVNTALTTLLGGSKNVEKELKSLGVSIFNSSGKFIGMRGVIAQLAPKLSHLSDQQKMLAEKTLFGSSAAQLMGTIIKGGVAGYDKAAAAVNKTGTAQAAAEKQANTLKGQTEKLKSGLEDLGVRLGEWLIPKLLDLEKIIAKVVVWFEKHKTVAMALALVIGAILVPAVLLYAASMTEAAVASVAANPEIYAIAAAVAVLAAGAYELYKHWSTVWNAVKTAALDAWNEGLKPVFNLIKTVAIDQLKIEMKALEVAWSATWDAIKTVINGAWNDVIKPVFGFVKDVAIKPVEVEVQVLETIWSTTFNTVKGVLNAAWSVIKQIFGFIQTVAINPLESAVAAFSYGWGKVWGGIQTAVEDAWQVIKPIIDAIKNAVGGVVGAVGKVTGAVGSAITGSHGLTHGFGLWANGGWVNAPAGTKVPGFVHGGEYVLSNAMLAGAQPIDPSVMNAVLKSMDNGTAALAGALGGAGVAARPAVAGSAGQTFVVNNYGMPTDPNQLASEIGWQLRPYLRAGA